MSAQTRTHNLMSDLRRHIPAAAPIVLGGLLAGVGAVIASRNATNQMTYISTLGGLTVLALAGSKPRVLLYALILFLPVETIGPLSLMQSKVIKLALMLLLLGIEFARRCIRRDARWKRSPYDMFILAFLASASLSTILSRDPLSSARSVVQAALIFGFFALVVNRVDNKQTVLWLVKAMLVVAVFVTVYGILQKYFGYGLFGSAYIREKIVTYYEIIGRRLFSVMNNPNALGGYLGTMFPIALSMLLLAKIRWRWRAALAGLLALMAVVMLWAGSRGAMMGVAAAAGIMLFLLRKNRAFVILLTVVLLLSLGGILYTYEQETLSRYLRVYDSLDVTLSGRWAIWETAVHIAKDHPGAGIGFYTWTTTYPEYGLSFWKTVDNPHNLLLNMAVEQGIPGVILYVWFVILFLVTSFKFVRQTRAVSWAYPLMVGILGAGISRIVHEVFEADTLLGVSSVSQVFWALLALQIVAARIVRREQRAVRNGGEA
jgi:putative inorganic carbon (HCO3(-)) transporter